LTLEKDNDLREFVRKVALLNALQHGGKAQTGAIMGRVIGERQELKTKVAELSGLINQVVEEVNELSSNEQKLMIQEKWPGALK
jgi:glutamyl-tRNA synthetase